MQGRIRPDDRFVVGAHYDSISGNPFDAPGAEDNASGCAGVLEIARIFAANPPEATIHFVCYAGEEQGLHGSTAHVADLTLRLEQRLGTPVELLDPLRRVSIPSKSFDPEYVRSIAPQAAVAVGLAMRNEG